ncbi:MAG: serine hydrolase [Cyanobacteria bacterium P01_A01_bin.116]
MSTRLSRRSVIFLLFALSSLTLAATGKRFLTQLRAASYWFSQNVLFKFAKKITFETATPESFDISSAQLNQLTTALKAKNTHSFIVVKNDKIIHEWYGDKDGMHDKHRIASGAKAIVGGFALAIALNDQLIDIQEFAATYVPQWESHPQKSKITIEQLARHSSGLENAEENGQYGPQLAGWKGNYWRNRENRWKISIDQAPLIFSPGTGYTYSNPGTSALSYIFARIFSTTALSNVKQALQTKVMKPLGIPDYAWSINYGGEPFRANDMDLYYIDGGAAFTARALARLGEVMLNKGKWQGKTILTEEVVSTLVDYNGRPSPDTLSNFPSPGLLWHTNANNTFPSLPKDAFIAAGASHQILCIIPSLDIVIVRMGDELGPAQWYEEYWQDLESLLFQPIMSAVNNLSSTD